MQILLVEDEISIAETVIFALEREGYAVAHCLDASTAKQQFADHDLAILDVGLPDQNGFELFADLRARGLGACIFLTARSDEIDRVVGLEMGGDDYMTKPFSPRELIARVRSVLRRVHKAEPAQALETIEALTAAESRLLRKLQSAPRQIFSRQQLIADVFGINHPSGERSIDTLVKSLRRKLPAPEQLKTHRGLGYSFEC